MRDSNEVAESGGPAVEKPENGLAGLKHWRYDLPAGLLVSLISVPFSLGIAVSSGAPPISGLISAIIAGLVLPFLGGSYVTVSGPAAGLAPALFAAMILLGRGDRAVGYPLLLVAICLTGVVQVVLSRLKAARLSAVFPSVVVEAMLASIGLMIIVKQLPDLLGRKYVAHDFFGIIAETPARVGQMDGKVFGLAFACLSLIFGLGMIKARWMKAVRPPVIVAFVGIAMGRLVGIEPRYLVHIPDHPFAHGIVWPDFKGVWADKSLWYGLGITVLTLTLIDGVESLATIAAIDRIDPFHRRSNPDRTLFAMGVSNVASSLAGGLTIIPGGVKSTACIAGGGRTQWANFYNACFLLTYLFLGRDLINMIPLGSLAAILVYIGYKLCRPAVWRHAAHVGAEQLVLFVLTVAVTLCTDLLWGIVFGTVAKLILSATLTLRAGRPTSTAPASKRGRLTSACTRVLDLFRDPVTNRCFSNGVYRLDLGRPLVCFNMLQMNRELVGIPFDARIVQLHMTEGVTLIDHTSHDNLTHFAAEFTRSGRGRIDFVGMDRMRKRSEHPSGIRLGSNQTDAAVVDDEPEVELDVD